MKRRSFTDCVVECDAAKHWPLSEELIGGIFEYVAVSPTEWTWKLKLKKLKWMSKHAEAMAEGQVVVPDTDQDLYDETSTDEEWDGGGSWKSPDLLQAELCICFCACDGAPLVTAPAMARMQSARPYKRNKAKIHFKPPRNDGGSEVIGYQVTSIPGGIVKNGTRSPIKVRGLNHDVWYQFVVRAQNRVGFGAPSIPSNPVRIC